MVDKQPFESGKDKPFVRHDGSITEEKPATDAEPMTESKFNDEDQTLSSAAKNLQMTQLHSGNKAVDDVDLSQNDDQDVLSTVRTKKFQSQANSHSKTVKFDEELSDKPAFGHSQTLADTKDHTNNLSTWQMNKNYVRQPTIQQKQDLSTVCPVAQLSFMQQSQLKFQATNENITPVDQSILIQTINHPKKNGVTIQVVIVNQNVSHQRDFVSEFQSEDETMPCQEPGCNSQLVGNVAVKNENLNMHTYNVCDIKGCENELNSQVSNSYFSCHKDHNGIENENSFKCDQSDQSKHYCRDCVVKYWLRHHQTSKTKEQFKCRELSLPPLERKNILIKKLTNQQFIEIQEFPETEERKKCNFYAIVSFWSQDQYKQDGKLVSQSKRWDKDPNNINEPECYHQIRIDNPRFISRSGQESKLNLKEMLFVSEDSQQIFCFSNDDCRMNLIDVNDDFPQATQLKFQNLAQEKLLRYLNFSLVSDEDQQSNFITLPSARLFNGCKNLVIGYPTESMDRCLNYQLFFIDCTSGTLQHTLDKGRVIVKSTLQQDSFWVLKAEQIEVYKKGEADELELNQSKYLKKASNTLINTILDLQPLVNDNQKPFLINYCLQQFSWETFAPQAQSRELDIIASAKDYELDCYLHLNNTRITVIAKNFNWITLDLNFQENSCRHVNSLRHAEIIQDAEVLKHNDELFIVCCLKYEEQSYYHHDHLKCFTFKVVDLNKKLTGDDKLKKNQQLSGTHVRQIQIELPGKFRKDDTPMKIMQFTHYKDQLFQTQIIYMDDLTAKSAVYMVMGVIFDTKQLQDEDFEQALSQYVHFYPVQSQIQFMVQYPILCYTLPDPEKKTLMVVNLQKNQKQIKLHLQLPFLQFMESRSLFDNESQPTCEIDFITHRGSELQVFRLQFDPYTQMEEKAVRIKRIETSFKVEQKKCKSLLKGCALISKSISNSLGNRYAIVLQTTQDIFVIQKINNELKVKSQFKHETNYKMSPLHLIRGRGKVYYNENSELDGDRVVSLQFNNNSYKIEKRTIYKQKEKILYMQMDTSKLPDLDGVLLEDSSTFFLLDSSYKLRILQFENSKKHTSAVSLMSTEVIDLANQPVKRLFRSLEAIPFQKIVLSQNGILCCRLHENSKKGVTIAREQVLYSLQSDSRYKREYFKTVTRDYCGLGYKTLHCEQIIGLAKTISLVQENGFQYFCVNQAPSSRRIDLMSHRFLCSLNTEIFLLNRHIFLSITDQKDSRILVFSQKSLMLQKIIANSKVEGFVEDTDRAEIFVRIVKKDDKTYNIPPDLYYFDSKNHTFLVLFKQDFLQSFESISGPLERDLYSVTKDGLTNQKKGWTVCRGRPYLFGNFAHLNNPVSEENIINSKKYIFYLTNKQDLIKDGLKSSENGKVTLYHSYFSECSIDVDDKKDGPKRENNFIVTRKYIIFSVADFIFYIERALIQKYDQKDKFNLQNYCVDNHIKTIDLKLLFNGEKTIQYGYTYKFVSQKDLHIASQQKHEGEKLREAIQISFINEAIMWDLDSNSEITSLTRMHDFSHMTNYARTGFTYYKLQALEDKTPYRFTMTPRYCKFFQTNFDGQYICSPGTEFELPQLRRPYSFLEMTQLLTIETLTRDYNENHITENHISLRLLTSNINGNTIYSLFYKYPRVFQIIYDMILKMKVSIDSSEKADQITMRRVYYTICLPFHGDVEPENEDQTSQGSSLLCCSRNPIVGNKSKVTDDMSYSFNNQSSIHQINRGKTIKVQAQLQQFDQKNQSQHNLIQYLLDKNDSQFEKLIQIILQSDECSLRALVQNFHFFKKVFKIQCDAIEHFIENAFINTQQHKGILSNIEWDSNDQAVIFCAHTAMYSKKKIRQEISAQIKGRWYEGIFILKKFGEIFSSNQQKELVEVRVRIIDISWLNKNIENFYKFMSQQRPALFDNDLIRILLNTQSYTWKIVLKYFLPYVVYMGLVLYYCILVVPMPDQSLKYWDEERYNESIVRLLILAGSIFLSFVEILQMVRMKMDYWKDIWNYGNISMIILDQFVVTEHATHFVGLSTYHLIVVTIIMMIQLWVMFYYWWRLNNNTAFYVKMLTEVILDLKYFMLLYLMMICTFSSTSMVLNQYFMTLNIIGDTDHTYAELYDKQTQSVFFDAFINQWILGLGEFYPERFAQNQNDIIWYMFILATFFTNIVFLNMLIAIMQDTFTKITLNKRRNGLMQQTALYADFIQTLKVDKRLNTSKYMYIIEPNTVKNQEEELQGFNQVIQRLKDQESRQRTLQDRSETFMDQELKTIKEQINCILDAQRSMNQLLEEKKSN